MKEKELIPKKLRFRVVVSIPLILTLFTLGSGFLIFNLASVALPGRPVLPQVLGAIIILGVVACLSGIGVAYAIINPLKKLATKMETALIEEEEPKKIKASNEIEALSVLFNRAFPSLDRLIKDKQILDNLPEGIIALAKDGKVINLNIVLEETFGLKKSQAKGKHYSELFPESLENAPFFSLVEKLVKGELDRAEGEFRIAYKKDREGTFWITARNIEGGKEKVISFKDLLEIDSVRREIKKTEQLALLGTLAYGIAHEVRNPLGSFRGMTELIQEDLAPGDEKRIYTQTMLREVDRLNHLVEDILNYSTPPCPGWSQSILTPW